MDTVFDIEKALCKIKEIGEKLLPYAIKMDGRGRTGGYLCIANRFGAIIAIIRIGEVKDPETAANYRYNAQAKVLRLAHNPKHFSGWQSRDFDNKDYGGSIRDFYENLYGFSGFNEQVDEALSAAIPSGLGEYLMPLELQERIAAVSGNPHLIELCERGADWDLLP